MMDMINKQEVLTQVATNLIEDSIKGAWEKVKKYLKIWMRERPYAIRQPMKVICKIRVIKIAKLKPLYIVEPPRIYILFMSA